MTRAPDFLLSFINHVRDMCAGRPVLFLYQLLHTSRLPPVLAL